MRSAQAGLIPSPEAVTWPFLAGGAGFPSVLAGFPVAVVGFHLAGGGAIAEGIGLLDSNHIVPDPAAGNVGPDWMDSGLV
jgi:hypothetical protein